MVEHCNFKHCLEVRFTWFRHFDPWEQIFTFRMGNNCSKKHTKEQPALELSFHRYAADKWEEIFGVIQVTSQIRKHLQNLPYPESHAPGTMFHVPVFFCLSPNVQLSVAAQLWHSWAMVWAQSSALCAGWQLSFSRTVLGKGSSSCFPFQGKCMLTWMSITWIICKSQVSCIFRVTVNGKAYVANGCSFLLRSGLALVASCSSWWPALKSRSQSSSLSYKIFYNPHCNVPVGKKTR